MIELFLFILGFVGGTVLGINLGWRAREQAAKKFVTNYLAQVQQEAKSNTVTIEVSKEGEMFLVHNKETGEFLAQGTNHEEVSEILRDRFPTKTFICTPENIERVGYPLGDV